MIGVPARRRQLGTLEKRFRRVVVKPAFAWFEARDDRMSRCLEMPGCVFSQRVIAASDVTALRTSSQVEPPAVRRFTFDASGARWLGDRVHSMLALAHPSQLGPERLAACRRWEDASIRKLACEES